MTGAELRGKSLVVIGGTTGIGLSAARAFVAQGAKVVIVGRKPDSVKAALRELGRAARGFSADASNRETAPAAVALAVKTFGGFHGLYHVAGGSGRWMGDGPLHQLTDKAWHATIELNLTSTVFSNRAALRQFLQQQSGGSILNMSSVLGFSPSPGHFATHAYAASKAAIIELTRATASYYAAHNIRCNVLAPGVTETPMAQRALADKKIQHFIKTKQPLDGGRVGRPDDLDAAAVYFMSDASRFTTGQILAIDGGWSVSEGQLSDEAIVLANNPAKKSRR